MHGARRSAQLQLRRLGAAGPGGYARAEAAISNTDTRRAVMGSAALALLCRLARLAEAAGSDPFYQRHLLDSAFYDEMARRILDGTLDGPYLMAPLYGYFLAAIYAVSGALGIGSPTPVYLAQALMGAGTAALAAALGARVGRRLERPALAAWVAGLAVAIYPVMVIYDARLLSVSLATFLATLGAYALQRVWDAEDPPRWLALAAGLVLGLATTARGNLLFALPLLALAMGAWALRRRRPAPALLLLVGLAAPLALTAAHNRAETGSAALVSVNGGINLYRGNNPWFVDEAVQPFRLPGEEDALARKARLVASIESDRWLDEVETDRYWIGRTLDEWRRAPTHYAALALRKTVAVLSGREIADNADTTSIRRASVVLRWLPPLWGPLVALGLLGLAVSARWREDLPLLIQLVVGIGSVAIFFVVDRYRLPLAPIWAAYAGGAVAWIHRGWPQERGRVIGGLGVALALWAWLGQPVSSAVFPWNALVRAPPTDRPCAVDRMVIQDPTLDVKFRVGAHHLFQGDLVAAEAAFREVLAQDPSHPAAGVNLSTLLLERGTPASAREAAEITARVLGADPCDDKAYANLGLALERLGQLEAALGALSKAIEIEPYEPDWRAAQGQIWLALKRPAEARKALEFAVRWDPEGWQARALLARLALREKSLDEAVALLEEATKLQPDRAELWALLGLAWLGKGELDPGRKALEAGEAARDRTGVDDPVLQALRRAYDAPSPWAGFGEAAP